MGDTSILTVTAEPLTAGAWQPFGQVIGGPQQGSPSCVLELRDGAVFHLDVLSYTWHPLRCDLLNRHHTATQALIPLGGAPAVVVVAPREVDFSEASHLDTIRAFTISGQQGINLAIGTWHWGPYPTGPDVHLANFQARDVANDNEIAYLERDLGTVVEVRV
ncbi:MAG TPA: ureidoglycolate lyase [Acidimicrobiales bacterium]|nr:ureidoglycolate lyase [Acidimicrobiales bacterium]